MILPPAAAAASSRGGVVVEAPILGCWVAPNLTTGQGSVTRDYAAADWDHAVRHGLRRGGRSSSMPSIEFVNLSDHELSDIVACIRNLPPVDRDLGRVKFGPVFQFVMAFDSSALVAFHVDHEKAHAVEPPQSAPTAEYGEHIVQVCRGCHGANLSGGKIQGDPNMPIIANITPHETGLRDWGDAELQAIWAYLRTVPAVEKGNR